MLEKEGIQRLPGKSIVAVDVNKLTRSELAKLVTKLDSAANKRIRRIEGAGVVSPAILKLKERFNQADFKFSVRGKNLNELRKQYTQVMGFLGMKTSTLTGARKFERDFSKRFTNGEVLSESQKKVLFDAYRFTFERFREKIKVFGSDKLISMYASFMQENNINDEMTATTEKAQEQVERILDYFNKEIKKQKLEFEFYKKEVEEVEMFSPWFKMDE